MLTERRRSHTPYYTHRTLHFCTVNEVKIRETEYTTSHQYW